MIEGLGEFTRTYGDQNDCCHFPVHVLLSWDTVIMLIKIRSYFKADIKLEDKDYETAC